MHLHLIAVGTKMPHWVNDGLAQYLPRFSLQCRAVPAGQRSKQQSPTQAIASETQAIIKALPKNPHIVTLEVKGQAWSTETLAEQLGGWEQAGQDVAFIIGGPDGLGDAIRQMAHQRWSLSNLTLPHPLARLVVVEQLYRATTIRQGHPYHRMG